jgi:acetylglutamate kinase
MESRRQRPARIPSIKRKPRQRQQFLDAIDGVIGDTLQHPAFSLPNIAQLIEDGEISIGMLRPIGCVASAADEDCTYATLVRRRGESLLQLLIRFDQAIEKALTLGISTDEINR